MKLSELPSIYSEIPIFNKIQIKTQNCIKNSFFFQYIDQNFEMKAFDKYMPESRQPRKTLFVSDIFTNLTHRVED